MNRMGMKIGTKYIGEIELEQEHIIEFQTGLPGFLDEKRFVLLNIPGNTVFQTLQSVKTPNLAFVVTDPYFIYQDYTFELDDNMIAYLKLETERDVKVLSIVTLKKPFDESTINLKAPIIINVNSNQGKQYILNDDTYLTKAPITAQAEKGPTSCSY